MRRRTRENQENLEIRQGEVVNILVEDGSVTGVQTYSGAIYRCKAVVLCTGTYLKARCIYGDVSTHTGPNGLQAANYLTDCLKELGIKMYRFKTGTPARIDKRSIDFSKMEEQFGDERVVPFSFTTDPEDVQIEQASCWLTYTNPTTHEIIRKNLDRSPLYSGMIEGTGPRYCPSIEDKVVKFADKNRHQVFLEPEGLHTNEMYIGGMSSSLPEDVQHEMYHTVAGLEHAKIVRNAYAIEYDCINPRQLDAYDNLNSQAAISSISIGQQSAQLATAAASLDSSKKELEKSRDDALDKSNLNAVLTIDSLSQLLVAQNFDMPAGYVNDSNGMQYIVQVGDEIKSIDDLTNLVLMDMKLDGIAPIHVSDVADVEMTDNSDETYAIVNGNPGIMLSMEKQTGYSTGDVTDRLLDKLDSLEKENDGLHTTVLMNQGVYIDMVVKSVMENMIVGAILAIFVLLLFLKDIKPTLVIAASIPLSVIVAVVLMYFTDITLNIISMSGLVLGIGMLVDNSIVVIENIYRLRGEGYSVKKAAVEGANQVAGAIFASTLTTVSVYAPIIFTDGITRQLFVDLALTVAFTLMASLVVALTFVPAIASGMLKKTKDIKHPWFDRFKDWYGNVLGTCLRFKPVVFIAARILLFAVVDLLMTTFFFGVSVYTLQISAYRLIIDFLVPFNVSCCICFRLLYSKWNDMEYIAVFLSIACILIWTLIVSTDSIYQRISMPIWGSLLIISFGYLIFCVHKSQCNCEINWEVKSSGTAI